MDALVYRLAAHCSKAFYGLAGAPKRRCVSIQRMNLTPRHLCSVLIAATLAAAGPLLAQDANAPDAVPASEEPSPAETPPAPEPRLAYAMLGGEVPPGERRQLAWSAGYYFGGVETPTPVLVAHGAKSGPTLCLTAAVHGDELTGIEVVRRVVYSVDPKKLSGTVIGVPIVNIAGFQRHSRYLPDRRDLNRHFPGSPTGSLASRVAYSFFTQIIQRCERLVDLHTGSFHRTNLPQLRADLANPDILEMTKGFGGIAVLQSAGAKGTLRRAAADTGIPAVTIEAGEPLRLQPTEVDQGVKGIETLMHKLGMVERNRLWPDPQPVFYESRWVRANRGGILLGQVALGERVRAGSLLGTVTDPITNVESRITSPHNGRVLGMALNQVVMPGFAAFRVGIETTEEDAAREASEQAAEAEDADAPASPEGDDTEGELDSEAAVPERAAPKTRAGATPAQSADEDEELQEAPVQGEEPGEDDE